jgi:hypothetical protein
VNARQLRPEPLWYLKGLSYSDYLHSDHWKLRRQEFLAGREQQCERCELEHIDETVSDDGAEVERRAPRFNVHHLSYERLGEELDEDLMLLCAPCHNLEHRPDSHAGRWWHRFLTVRKSAAA